MKLFYLFQFAAQLLLVESLVFKSKNFEIYRPVVIGETVLIDCTTDKNDVSLRLVKRDTRKKTEVELTPDGSHLKLEAQKYTILINSLKDGGTYVCDVQSEGSRIEKSLIVAIATGKAPGDIPKPILPYNNTLIKEGRKLVIPCKTQGKFAKLSWEKDGTELPGLKVTNKPLTFNDGVVTVESILTLDDVTLSDVGTYTCVSTSRFDQTKTAKSTVILNVRGISLTWEKNTPATFNAVTARAGTSAIISCRMTHPAKKVNFYRALSGVPLIKIQANQDKYQFINDQELVIKRISLLDVGTYICKTEDGVLKDKRISLFVDDSAAAQPYVRVFPKFLNLDYNDAANVTCETYGNNARVQWMRNVNIGGQFRLEKVPSSKILGSSSITDQGNAKYTFVLIFKNVTVKDTGNYVCKVSVNGQPAFSEVNIAVRPPLSPQIRKFSSQVTTENVETNLNCRSKGAPKPNIKFFKNNIEITSKTPGYRIVDRKLFIDKPKFPDHDGSYTCSVSNMFGKATGKANLTVTVSPVIDKEKSIVVVGDPNDLKILCKIKRSNPTPKITWEYQPWPCPPSKGYQCKPSQSLWQQADSKYVIPASTDITMNSTFKVPVGDATNYFIRCKAEHQYGKDFHQVIGVIDKRDASSLLRIAPKSIETDEEQTFSLLCTGDAGLFTKLTWQLNNTNIIPNNQTVFISNSGSVLSTQKSLLTITNVKPLQSGSYKCIGEPARTQDEPVEYIANAKINKIYKPKLLTLTSPSVSNGEMALVTCDVDAHPYPIITWYKDNKILNNNGYLRSIDECDKGDDGKYFLLDNNSVDTLGTSKHQLVICKSAWKINNGTYSCEAKNALGKSQQDTALHVYSSPVMLFNQLDEYATPGEEYSRNCSSEGNPQPHIWWEKDNNGVYVAVTKNSTNKFSFLNFSRLGHNDFGKYRCVAANSFGVTVEAMFLKQPLITAAHNNSANDMTRTASLIAALIAGVFIVVLLSILVVILYKRKKLYGGFYILSIPPSPDYFRKLDPTRSISEQVHKLPYFPEWEFPRNKVKLKNQVGAGAFGEVYIADAFGIISFDPRYKISTKHKALISKNRFSFSNYKRSRSSTSSSTTKIMRTDSVASTRSNRSTKSSTKLDKSTSSIVAVKKLKEDATQLEYKDLISEMKILIHIGQNENIVNLLGACTKGVEKDTMCILEFCPHGNLLSFMKERRQMFKPIWSKQHIGMEKEFTTFDLCVTAYQIAKGLDYLASRKCVHRDVAARNVLVGENYVMKIADFGLARDVYQDERYVKISGGLLPIKWMAIEAIMDRVFTHKTDVWSFGILLWELMTLGGSPYPGVHVKDLLDYLTSGNRMAQPQFCPNEIYQLMRECWNEVPAQRPIFSDIVLRLARVIEGHCNPEEISLYVDKCHISGGSFCFADQDYLRPVDAELGSFHYSPPPPYDESAKNNENDQNGSVFKRKSSERYVPDNRFIEEQNNQGNEKKLDDFKDKSLNSSSSDRSIEPKAKMEEYVSEKDDSVFIDMNAGNEDNNNEVKPLYKNIPYKEESNMVDEDKDIDENSQLLNHRTPSAVEELSNYLTQEYEKMGHESKDYVNS